MAGDGRRSVYDKKSQRYAKTTELHLLVRSSKSEAEVSNKCVSKTHIQQTRGCSYNNYVQHPHPFQGQHLRR